MCYDLIIKLKNHLVLTLNLYSKHLTRGFELAKLFLSTLAIIGI